MPWGPAIAAAGSVASGIIGSRASGDAAKVQADAAREATGVQKQMYDQTTANLAPWLNTGKTALGDLTNLLGIGDAGGPTSPILKMLGIGPGGLPTGGGTVDPSQFHFDPGQQYRLQSGRDAVMTGTHGNIGGNTLAALMDRGQQTANQGWQQYLGNLSGAWQQQIGNVAQVAGSGQNAAVQQGTANQNFGNAASGNIWGGANANANGIMGNANAIGGGINGALQALLTAYNATPEGKRPEIFSGTGPFSADSFNRLFGGQVGPGYGALDPNRQSVAPNTWSQQPDSYYLPGGAGYSAT